MEGGEKLTGDKQERTDGERGREGHREEEQGGGWK